MKTQCCQGSKRWSPAESAGYEAAILGKPITANPYLTHLDRATAGVWDDGWWYGYMEQREQGND